MSEHFTKENRVADDYMSWSKADLRALAASQANFSRERGKRLTQIKDALREAGYLGDDPVSGIKNLRDLLDAANARLASLERDAARVEVIRTRGLPLEFKDVGGRAFYIWADDKKNTRYECPIAAIDAALQEKQTP